MPLRKGSENANSSRAQGIELHKKGQLVYQTARKRAAFIRSFTAKFLLWKAGSYSKEIQSS